MPKNQPKATVRDPGRREDSGGVLEAWEGEIERIYRLYKAPVVKASEYGHIDESKIYPEA